MHPFDVATVLTILSLIGVEFSVSAFINPAARRLDPEPQLTMLSRSAFVFGKVMPLWYPACGLLLGVETWLYWKTSERNLLLVALAIWIFASLASIVFLVPLNTRIARRDADWQRIHRIWDNGHRVRTAALAIAGVLLTYVVVR